MKKKPVLLAVIILILLFLGVFSYIYYEKLDDTNEKDTDVLSNVGWVDYLNNQSLVVKTSVWNFDSDECEFKALSISSDDVKSIINELSTKKITKHYYGSVPPTGTVCSNRYTLEYGNNKISLEANGYAWVDDTVLSNKLDLDIDDTTYADDAGTDFVYAFDVDFDSILDRYVDNVNKNTEWIDYLKQFDLTIEKSEFNYDKDECEYKEVSLSKEFLNNVFDELSTKRLTKYYYGSLPPVGSVCNNNFILKYGDNKLFFSDSGAITSEDSDLNSKLELTLDKVTYADDADESFNYMLDVDFAKLIDNYK